MYFILDLLFGIFQGVAYWGKIEGREPKKSIANKCVAVAVIVILILIVILICVNNPELHLTEGDMV